MNERPRKHPFWTLLLAAGLLLAARRPALGQGFQSSTSNVGYIDNAIPGNMFRVRFEAAYDINRSDRAEYIYQRGADPRIDYQDGAIYGEWAFLKDLSVFVEMHEHAVNPELAPNAVGLGDMNVGCKWAFHSSAAGVETFQLRTYIPTANPLLVLGPGHASVEPGLLLFHRLTDRLYTEGELKDWIPLSENGFAGNILNYGLGVSYVVADGAFRLAPVCELVGWTVLSGKETVVAPSGVPPLTLPPGVDNTSGFPVKSAAGDTIVNVKLGIRIRCGDCGDIYAGYGRALTGAFWYKNMFRVEYRYAF
jgi:hypothetical protein